MYYVVPIRRSMLCALAFVVSCDTPADDDGPADSAGGKADGLGENDLLAVSATSVEALERDLSSVFPRVEQFVVGDPLAPGDYLKPMSALGHYGPLGAYGPLGVLGPVGENTWNPSTFVDLAAPWDFFARSLTELEGPLSAEGPLGANGPLNPNTWADLEGDGLDNDFLTQLEPAGVFAPLGPVGPLGALGPLGPLGPTGAHGYATDGAGQYVAEGRCAHSDESEVCRTAVVAWDDTETRDYELFERYTEEFAASMPDNDTSFMVIGEAQPEESDSFVFTSRNDQFVTVLVMGQWTKYEFFTGMALLGQAALLGYELPIFVPGFFFPFNRYDHATSFDDYDLSLLIESEDGTQSTSIVSDTGLMIDWVHVRVPAGAEITAEVRLFDQWSAPWRFVDSEYRLFVVGSTEHLGGTRISGNHQVALRPEG